MIVVDTSVVIDRGIKIADEVIFVNCGELFASIGSSLLRLVIVLPGIAVVMEVVVAVGSVAATRRASATGGMPSRAAVVVAVANKVSASKVRADWEKFR